jgi:signal transduction protein with GAF and PtsI domain
MRSVATFCLFALFAADLRAEVFKGEVKKVDAEKGILTIAAKDKEQEFQVPAGAKVTVQVAAGVVEAKDGLKNPWFQRAAEAAGKGLYRAEVTVEKKEGKEVVTKVHLFTPTRREDPER